MLERVWRKGILLTLLVGMQVGTATLENSVDVLKKLKIELPYDPAIALLDIYPNDTDVLKRRATCTPMFIAAMSTIAKSWKELRCPSTDEWIKKMWSIYIQRNISHQKERLPNIWSNMDGTGDYGK